MYYEKMHSISLSILCRVDLWCQNYISLYSVAAVCFIQTKSQGLNILLSRRCWLLPL